LGAALVLLVLLALLWFSMRRHLKRAARFSEDEGVDIHAPRTAGRDDDPTT
jgi:hypothetical protein